MSKEKIHDNFKKVLFLLNNLKILETIDLMDESERSLSTDLNILNKLWNITADNTFNNIKLIESIIICAKLFFLNNYMKSHTVSVFVPMPSHLIFEEIYYFKNITPKK